MSENLQDAILSYLDGTADDAAIRGLNERLSAEPQACRELLLAAALETHLRQILTTRQEVSRQRDVAPPPSAVHGRQAAPPRAAEPHGFRPASRWRRRLAVAASLLVATAAGWLAFAHFYPGQGGPREADAATIQLIDMRGLVLALTAGPDGKPQGSPALCRRPRAARLQAVDLPVGRRHREVPGRGNRVAGPEHDGPRGAGR